MRFRLQLFLIPAFAFFFTRLFALTVTFGPEVYHMQRLREGGTEQNGILTGIYAAVERLQPNAIYLGVDYLFARGSLRGETGSHRKLKSTVTDHIFEARGGLCFSPPLPTHPFFVAFGGYGYFCELNDFEKPSPIPVSFKDTFNYVVAGFLSGVNFTPLVSMGINFKVRFMLDGRSKVTNDPLFDDVTLQMRNEIQYRLDIPFEFTPCGFLLGGKLLLAPFYEFRHFGGREGFPFNFRDTKFHLIGIRLALRYGF